MWWVDRKRRSRVIGLVTDMTKSEARAAVDRIVTEVNAAPGRIPAITAITRPAGRYWLPSA